jgi:hypothetical protein
MSNRLFSILKFTSVSILLGWGLRHLFWDIPYRAFFWNHLLFSWFVEDTMGWNWSAYVTSSATDNFIIALTRVLGVLLIACAVSILYVDRTKATWPKWALYIGSAVVALVAVVSYIDKGFQMAMPLEFAAQIGAPIFLARLHYGNVSMARQLVWLKAAIAVTFVAHGMYAIGYLPQPGHFVDMVINVFHVNESTARIFLKVIGAIDISLGITLFLPRLQTLSLYYAAAWGFMTMLARPLSYMADADASTMAYWASEALYRVPHGGLPLLALLVIWNTTSVRKSPSLRLESQSV